MSHARWLFIIFLLCKFVPAHAMCDRELDEWKKLMKAGDDQSAVTLLKRFADSGDNTAQFLLAEESLEGYGTGLGGAAVANYMRQAAEAGFPQAEFAYGAMLDQGISIPQDQTAAFSWYQKSADHGNALAEFNLANMYENGITVQPDKFTALVYYIATTGVTEANIGEKAKSAVARLRYNFSNDEVLRAVDQAKLINVRGEAARKLVGKRLANQKCTQF